ncbi:hypothetical protein Y032_0226g2773 [Ancylostoma ceylanicum]|uniref:Uncharacterized protein n=1 Tax=Ancylostoma ceylanicum TaxID=53326 RepID=A0A016SGR9_9BILA|nr:hypothetical protein Y032_0226g2773 [Ancylostoma ceylanicum]
MTDRGDDIYRTPDDSDDFVASDLPEETPQDLWLNDLLGPTSHTTQQSTKTEPRTLDNGDHGGPPNASESSIQGNFSLSSLISKLPETIANYPVEFAFLILAILICQWLYLRLKSK